MPCTRRVMLFTCVLPDGGATRILRAEKGCVFLEGKHYTGEAAIRLRASSETGCVRTVFGSAHVDVLADVNVVS
jgi:hypothetical protein